MNQTTTAIVPIKEHSERVPRKNFRDFNGKPLYHWILETLEATDVVDDVVVNTDADQVIDSASEQFDVTISERPPDLCGDFVSMNDIIASEVTRRDADVYVQTHCTNPLLEPDTISEAVRTFVDHDESDSLFTVTRHQKMLYDEDLNPINHDPDNLIRTQDLPPVYEENSNLYVFTERTIKTVGRRVGDDPEIHEMDEIESIDIDTPIDFEMAEYFHAKRRD